MTAREIEHARESQLGVDLYPYTYQQWFHDCVYIPHMTKLIADMRAKGLLPEDPL